MAEREGPAKSHRAGPACRGPEQPCWTRRLGEAPGAGEEGGTDPEGWGRVPEDRQTCGAPATAPWRRLAGTSVQRECSVPGPATYIPVEKTVLETGAGCVPPATPRGRGCVPTFTAIVRPRDKLRSFVLTLRASAVEHPLPCW